MQLNRNLWLKALNIKKEFNKREEELTRRKLSDALKITEAEARGIIYALENKEVISLSPNVVEGFTGTTKELILADIHVPYHNQLAIETVFNHINEIDFIPDVITLLGDTFDFPTLSRFFKRPTEGNVAKEVKMVKEFLGELRKTYPDSKIIFYQGNHDFHMERYIVNQSPDLYELMENFLEEKIGCHENNIEYMVDPFKLGKLWHMHGHEKFGGQSQAKYIVQAYFPYILDHFVIAHYHRSQDETFKKIDGTVFRGSAVGYLGSDMEYARINQWVHGFAMVTYDSNGNFRMENKKIFGGEVY